MSFTIYPAIDLRNGRVVRLQHGDPARQTVYDNDPAATADRWLAAGATWLHVVNLDGAFDETGAANWQILPSLARRGAQIQFGGGLRSLDDMDRALDAGAARLVLGTVAVEQPNLVEAAIGRFGPERLAIGVDARDGRVKTRGWQAGTAVTPLELARGMKQRGVATLIYTDINRDGVLTGPNAAATAELARASGLAVIASGGVAGLADVAELRLCGDEGVVGVIIGRALYEGTLDLAAAIRLAQAPPGNSR